MAIIAVTSNQDAQIDSYLGFGFSIIEEGINQFGDAAYLLRGPDKSVEWQALRLSSGNYAASIISIDSELPPSEYTWIHQHQDIDTWKEKWGFRSVHADLDTVCQDESRWFNF